MTKQELDGLKLLYKDALETLIKTDEKGFGLYTRDENMYERRFRLAIPKLIDRIEKLEKALEVTKVRRDHYNITASQYYDTHLDVIRDRIKHDNQEIDEMLR